MSCVCQLPNKRIYDDDDDDDSEKINTLFQLSQILNAIATFLRYAKAIQQ